MQTRAVGCGLRPRVLAVSAVEGGPCRFEQVTVQIMSVLQNVVLKQVPLVCLLIKAEPSVSQSVHSFTNVNSLEATRRGNWREKTCPVLAVEPRAGGSALLSLSCFICRNHNSGTYHIREIISARLSTYVAHSSNPCRSLCPLSSIKSARVQVGGTALSFVQ